MSNKTTIIIKIGKYFLEKFLTESVEMRARRLSLFEELMNDIDDFFCSIGN